RGPVTYIHLLFDTHEIINADGTWSESLHPAALDRDGLDAATREELHTLFPSLRTETFGFGPTARLALTARQASVFA
ncbi:MAG: Hint domain-containing protein, partial [Pseudomonadota bacterium]